MDFVHYYHKVSGSETALIISNLIPLFGVLFLDWNLFFILILYWSESAIIGFFNILKMALAQGVSTTAKGWSSTFANTSQKLFLIPFFMIHYGGFMAGHLAFIWVLFGQTQPQGTPEGHLSSFIVVILAWASLFVSHAVSFYTHYLQKEEYRTATVKGLMMIPYTRIIIMHLTIIFGAFFLILLGGPAWVLAFMILLKTAVDLASHRKEHHLRTKEMVSR